SRDSRSGWESSGFRQALSTASSDLTRQRPCRRSSSRRGSSRTEKQGAPRSRRSESGSGAPEPHRGPPPPPRAPLREQLWRHPKPQGRRARTEGRRPFPAALEDAGELSGRVGREVRGEGSGAERKGGSYGLPTVGTRVRVRGRKHEFSEGQGECTV